MLALISLGRSSIPRCLRHRWRMVKVQWPSMSLRGLVSLNQQKLQPPSFLLSLDEMRFT
jgi:hypothetical protein